MSHGPAPVRGPGVENHCTRPHRINFANKVYGGTWFYIDVVEPFPEFVDVTTLKIKARYPSH